MDISQKRKHRKPILIWQDTQFPQLQKASFQEKQETLKRQLVWSFYKQRKKEKKSRKTKYKLKHSSNVPGKATKTKGK